MRIFPIIFFLICATFTHAQDLNNSALFLDKNLTANANAVVRLDEMSVEIAGISEMNIQYNRVVTVLNKLGNKHTHTRVGYNNSVKVKRVEAIIYDALGNEIDKIKQKEFKDVSAVDGGTLYSDSRVLYLDYTPVQYPYTIAFTYEVFTENTANTPSWYFLDGFLVSTEKSRYQITYGNQELKPVIKEKNLNGITIDRTETENSITYLATDIKAVKRESLSPAFSKIAPKLMIRMEKFHYEGFDASVKDWKEMGEWRYDNLLKGQDALPEATATKARLLVKGVSDDLEKAKIIYKYVQDNTRYISVQIGIGGLRPISAVEVDRVKYGDCKGLSNYTQALLRAVGVTSYYVVVEAGSTKVDFDDDFPDLAQGNHIILAIPYNGQYYWIDCTSQVHPFGFIGDFTDDRKVFVITPDGGEIIRTPAYLNEQNYQKTSAHYALDRDGGISGKVTINTGGIQYDNRFYVERETPEKIEEHYKNYWDNINNLKLKARHFENDRKEVSFTEEVSLEAVNYASKSGNRMLFAPNAFNKNGAVPHRYRNRKLPFEIERGFLDEDQFVIQLPEGYLIEAIPKASEILNDFGAYTMSVTYRKEDHTLTYNRRLLIKEGTYQKDEYESYRAFRKEVAGLDNAQVVIVKSDL